ncbi:MAG: hypothetical protein JWP87_5674 [Labilithrix sp.]|nr:hypothetical protein [Labilithrix sp.]
MGQNIRRRDVIRAVPLVVFGSAVAGFGRFLLGCSSDGTPMRTQGPTKGEGPATDKPTDGDEFTPGTGEPPVVASEEPPKVPNPQWESRAKQLEGEQQRLYGAVFTLEAPGPMVGKQRSHVPQAHVTVENALPRVTVLVEHVMGKNLLEAGAPAADATVDAAEAGKADASADAAKEAEAGPPVEAGAAPIHYITTVYLRAVVAGKDTVVGLWEFASDDAAPPTVKFTLPAGVTSVVAYEWCTLHGLWKSAALSV